MRIPKPLKFAAMDDALACAHGIIAAIPFWHANFISSAQVIRERIQVLEDHGTITPHGAKALGWLNYLFTTYATDHALLLTHARAWLFLAPRKDERHDKHPCRLIAEGIVKFSGLTLKFGKEGRLTIDNNNS